MFKHLFFITVATMLLGHGVAQPVTNKRAGNPAKRETLELPGTAAKGSPLLSIKGAEYDPALHYMPYFSESLTITSGVPGFKFTRMDTRELSSAELEQVKPYKQLITANFEVSQYTAQSRNSVIAHYKITAVRLNPSTSRYEALTGYSFEWDYSKPLPNSPGQHKKISAVSFAATSVLSTGKWYKIALTKQGVYKIDKALLEEIGISTTGLDPRHLRLYGNGGKLMPEINSISGTTTCRKTRSPYRAKLTALLITAITFYSTGKAPIAGSAQRAPALSSTGSSITSAIRAIIISPPISAWASAYHL